MASAATGAFRHGPNRRTRRSPRLALIGRCKYCAGLDAAPCHFAEFRAIVEAQQCMGVDVSAPFILAPGEQHPALAPTSRGPFIRIASGQTGGLMALMEVELPPLTAGPALH